MVIGDIVGPKLFAVTIKQQKILMISIPIELNVAPMRILSMNNVNPKKLLHSKWTKVVPMNREKHFTIVEVELDEQRNITLCIIEAVISHKQYSINWRELKDKAVWRLGWC
ncbi:hypothetical protein TUM4630_08190 [Shewanella algidipiscicola]|uniref:TIGR02450 family Trp-rich protein n=2 Tax=Shewanella algidipiscicola TaxID=614070 RepID=A0ABQ4P8S9_9GAMM|nr:hypothetical protein TUM4630_08190 [Shewanella algidipiscicola]